MLLVCESGRVTFAVCGELFGRDDVADGLKL